MEALHRQLETNVASRDGARWIAQEGKRILRYHLILRFVAMQLAALCEEHASRPAADISNTICIACRKAC